MKRNHENAQVSVIEKKWAREGSLLEGFEAEVDNQILLVELLLKMKLVDIKTKFNNKTKVEIRNTGVCSLGESTRNQLRK